MTNSAYPPESQQPTKREPAVSETHSWAELRDLIDRMNRAKAAGDNNQPAESGEIAENVAG